VTHGNTAEAPKADPAIGLIPLNIIEIKQVDDRRLWHETVALFGYGTALQTRTGPTEVQVATYYDKDNRPVGQKIRKPGKEFSVIGDVTKEALPFGAQLWPKTGKKLVVTEGEIDAMSMSQAQGNKWPTVSIACGAGPQVKKYFSTHREYFRGFDEIILMFDSDSVGTAAAIEACETLALPYGRVKIASLPLKDASDMIKAQRGEELVNAMWRAKPYRPQTFVDIADISADILKGPAQGAPWPWQSLTKATFGRRPGEIYTLGAGTGIGKTSTWLQVGSEIVRGGSKVGFILFENSNKDAGLRIASALAGKPFFVPQSTENPWTETELQTALSTLAGKCLLYDTANADWESCESIMRYWAGAEGVKHIVFDHLSALSAEESDDRKVLDRIMSQLSKLVQELQINVYLITHLKRPMGDSHEEGGRVRLDQFRGSNAIAMWSNFAFGLERNQQSSDKSEQLRVTWRVLKDRNTGRSTGDTFHMRYDPATARLVEDGGHGFVAVAKEGF
jgi:twinkle protein